MNMVDWRIKIRIMFGIFGLFGLVSNFLFNESTNIFLKSLFDLSAGIALFGIAGFIISFWKDNNQNITNKLMEMRK